MEAMYQEYKDIAEFRMVYINEAHAADSDWSVEYAEELGINDHKNYEDRCQTADMLITDKELTIPTVIDGVDNAVNRAYSAWPDRIFLIRTDGRLAVAGGQGPWGYVPAMNEAKSWLKELRETKMEPALADGAIAAADERAAAKKKADEAEAAAREEERSERPLANYESKFPMGRIHRRPLVEHDGRTLLWAKGDPSGEAPVEDVEWFDMTDALVDPAQFQYGIGKDTIAPIVAPEYAKPGDARLLEFGITEDTEVVGFAHEGIARAYPIMILNGHEVVNDNFAGVPFAVCW